MDKIKIDEMTAVEICMTCLGEPKCYNFQHQGIIGEDALIICICTRLSECKFEIIKGKTPVQLITEKFPGIALTNIKFFYGKMRLNS